MRVPPAVCIPYAFLEKFLAVGLLDTQATPALEVSQETDQAGALISVDVPSAQQVLVERQLFHPRMVLLYFIEDRALLDDVRADLFLEKRPPILVDVRLFVRGNVEPCARASEPSFS